MVNAQTNIYFIRIKDSKYVKIGRSRDVQKRLSALSSCSPFTLEVIAILPGVECIQERLIHNRFRSYRVKNEWYNVTGELAKYLKNPYPLPLDDNCFDEAGWIKADKAATIMGLSLTGFYAVFKEYRRWQKPGECMIRWTKKGREYRFDKATVELYRQRRWDT